mmetsp:Transcript_64992/g.121027  ORF Transcript_64992/g.121027 Transcript_64992/m.121027 type:complete len:529 (+) Transcript_64992:76-1662(+)
MSTALPSAPVMPQDGAFDNALRQALESVMAAHTHVLRSFEAELRTAQLENSRLKERLREADLREGIANQQPGHRKGYAAPVGHSTTVQRHGSIQVPQAPGNRVEAHDDGRDNLADQEKLRRHVDEQVDHIVAAVASSASPSTDQRRALEVAGNHVSIVSIVGESSTVPQRGQDQRTTSMGQPFGHGSPAMLDEEEDDLGSPGDVAEGIGIVEANSSRPVLNAMHLKVEAASPGVEPTTTGQAALSTGTSGDAPLAFAEVPHSPATATTELPGASSAQVFDQEGVEDSRQEATPAKPAGPPNVDKFLEAFLAQHGWQHLEVVKVDRDHWTVSDVRFRLELTMVEGSGPSILATDGKGPWEPLEEVIRRRRLHKVVRTSSIATTHVFAAMMEEDWETSGDIAGSAVPAEAVAQAPLSLADLARLPKRAPPPAPDPKDSSGRAHPPSAGVASQCMSASRQGASSAHGWGPQHQQDQRNSSNSAGAHGHYKNGYGSGPGMSWGQHSGGLPSGNRHLPTGGAGGGYMAFARRV